MTLDMVSMWIGLAIGVLSVLGGFSVGELVARWRARLAARWTARKARGVLPALARAALDAAAVQLRDDFAVRVLRAGGGYPLDRCQQAALLRLVACFEHVGSIDIHDRALHELVTAHSTGTADNGPA